MNDVNDWNLRIIEEFRNNGGVCGGAFEGTPLLILHSTGAKTGLERLNPLAYQQLDGGWAIFASKAGAPTNPDWYHNLVANSSCSVEIGTETIDVTARVAEGAERERIWAKQQADMPAFAEYETSSGDREIPVIVLEPV